MQDTAAQNSWNALEVTLEIELPRWAVRHKVACGISERDADLNDLQHVDVASQRLVVKVGVAAKRPSWPGDNTWELRVLRGKNSYHRSNSTHQQLEHTMATYGYLSTTSRITAISSSRLCAHTSRISTRPPRDASAFASS